MDWKKHLTEEEIARLEEIERERKNLTAEYRRIYDRCRKRHRRTLDGVEMTTPTGHTFLIDKEDYEEVSQHRWFSVCHTLKEGKQRTPYIQGNVRGRRIYLHRFLLGEPPGKVVDHIDGDPLNNCRSNLRAVSHSENMRGAKAQRGING